MFSAKHFIWLAICAAGITLGLAAALRKKLTVRQAGSWMCIVCLLSEGCKMMTHMIPAPQGGMALDPQALPLHLCSMQIFVVLYITFAKDSPMKQKIKEFFVPTGLLGAMAALLIPIDGVEFWDIQPYQGFVYHSALVWLALYLLITKQVDLGFATYRRNLVILLMLVAAEIYANGALAAYDTNFLFLVRPPLEGLPLLNLDHGWYAYFAALVCLAVGILTVFHLPFMLKKKDKR